MWRVAGCCVLLAALGGCMCFDRDDDSDDPAFSTYKPPVQPSQAAWRQNYGTTPSPYPYARQTTPPSTTYAVAQQPQAPPPANTQVVSAAPAERCSADASHVETVQYRTTTTVTPTPNNLSVVSLVPATSTPAAPVMQVASNSVVPDAGASNTAPTGGGIITTSQETRTGNFVVGATVNADSGLVGSSVTRPLAGNDNPVIQPASIAPGSLTIDSQPQTLPAPVQPADKDNGPGAPGRLLIVSQDHDAKPTTATVRMLGTKRIIINYEVKDVGPSGIAGVDLWCTRDCREWKKYGTSPMSQQTYVIDVEDEGLYGFTLLARSGAGLGKEPPKTGDLPQVWVEVDVTRPVVRLTNVETGGTGPNQTVTVHWAALDKNMGPRPITLSYAEQAEGPWVPFAANLENTGSYTWTLPPGMQRRFLVRVEATDLAGNLGTVQSEQPVVFDMTQPTVSIVTVEAGK